MAFASWVDLRQRSPIDVSRLVSHANSFNSFIGVKISIRNMNNAKKSLINAKGELELMFASIQQFLSDREILKTKIDEIFYGWLIDDIGRYLKRIDEIEQDLLIKFDALDSDVHRVGISRLSSFSNSLKIACSLIYESFISSINEYEKIKEGKQVLSPKRKGITNYVAVAYDLNRKKVIKEKGKPLVINDGDKPLIISIEEEIPEEVAVIEKNKRTFLYILFQKVRSTMSTLGGLAREGKTNIMRKGQVGSMPTTWQGLLSNEGQKKIARIHESETGEKIEIDESMIEKSSGENTDTDENTLYFEEFEEDQEDESDN
jgi:hypothetical protein